MFVRGSFEVVSKELLFPALRAVGNGWATGDVSVAGEHMASHAAIRRLKAIFDNAGVDTSAAGSVVSACLLAAAMRSELSPLLRPRAAAGYR